jgi:SAM-dependent methyltransferase
MGSRIARPHPADTRALAAAASSFLIVGSGGEILADLSVAADYWAQQYGNDTFYRREWQWHPHAVAMRHALHGNRARADWFFETQMLGKPVASALSIGAGIAMDELHLLGRNAVRRFDLMDISDAGLNMAKADAQSKGIGTRIECIVADVNQTNLGSERYDLIMFMASLHHVEKMESVLRACDRALKPGGIIWASEYVGPDCFQFPPEHTSFAMNLYKALDPALKNQWYPELGFPTREEVLAADPTESVHSSKIIPLMRAVWPEVQFIGTYGTLAFIISWCLNYDALYDTEQGMRAMRAILDIDAALIDAGRLPHYYGHLIARKEN